MKLIDWTKPIRVACPLGQPNARFLLELKTPYEQRFLVIVRPENDEILVYLDKFGRFNGVDSPYIENVPPPPPPVIGRWAVWWQHVGHKEPTLCLYTSEAAMNSEYAQKIVRHKRMAPPFFIELKPGWVDVTDSPEYRGYEL